MKHRNSSNSPSVCRREKGQPRGPSTLYTIREHRDSWRNLARESSPESTLSSPKSNCHCAWHACRALLLRKYRKSRKSQQAIPVLAMFNIRWLLGFDFKTCFTYIEYTAVELSALTLLRRNKVIDRLEGNVVSTPCLQLYEKTGSRMRTSPAI